MNSARNSTLFEDSLQSLFWFMRAKRTNASNPNTQQRKRTQRHFSQADDSFAFFQHPNGKSIRKNSLSKGNSMATVFKDFMKKIKRNVSGLSDAERIKIETRLKKASEELENLEQITLQLGRILDYDNLKKQGVSAERIASYAKEDDAAIKKAKKFIQQKQKIREYLFGYPINLSQDSALIHYLRNLETKLCLINNCGDTYEEGNFSLESKTAYEQPILNKLYQHLGLALPKIKVIERRAKDGTKEKLVDYQGPWGYITPGGSESNKWGITNGLRKYPHAVVYYSKAAHYSVPKAVKTTINTGKRIYTINYVESELISTQPNSEKINVEELISKVKNNWVLDRKPAVILLTWGTTKTGAMDDVVEISKRLQSLRIAHYIHLDAALYGGIAKNQKGAPVLPDMKQAGIDSVSISLHKYFNSNQVNSVVIAKQRPLYEYVDYIGMEDSTISGSRSFSPFSTLQRITEILGRKTPDNYIKNVLFFDNLLRKQGIKFCRETHSNIFVINKPADAICKKYQLSTFQGKDHLEKAHIIIFPYHQKKIMKEFVKDLSTGVN